MKFNFNSDINNGYIKEKFAITDISGDTVQRISTNELSVVGSTDYIKNKNYVPFQLYMSDDELDENVDKSVLQLIIDIELDITDGMEIYEEVQLNENETYYNDDCDEDMIDIDCTSKVSRCNEINIISNDNATDNKILCQVP